jgi:hypothetical protein
LAKGLQPRSSKEIPLFLRNGQSEAFHDIKEILPDHSFSPLGFVVKDIGRMEGRHQRDSSEFEPIAMDPANFEGLVVPKHATYRSISQGDDDFRTNNLHLGVEIRETEIHFLGGWGAVPETCLGTRTPLEDIPDVDLFPGKTHSLDHSIELLAGWTDEGLGLLLFLFSGSLATEKDMGIQVALAKNQVPARIQICQASRAVEDFFSQPVHPLLLGTLGKLENRRN